MQTLFSISGEEILLMLRTCLCFVCVFSVLCELYVLFCNLYILNLHYFNHLAKLQKDKRLNMPPTWKQVSIGNRRHSTEVLLLLQHNDKLLKIKCQKAFNYVNNNTNTSGFNLLCISTTLIRGQNAISSIKINRSPSPMKSNQIRRPGASTYLVP